MAENNNTYRVHTNIREDKFLNVNINQDIEQLEILSLKLDVENFYKTHTSDYGCLVGRVLANQGVGVPNVKISVFIPAEKADLENPVFRYLYPYTSVKTKNSDGIRYNLLPETVDNRCHQDIGTFPNKRLVLDDTNTIEVFDKYFKYTTVTNNAGDYMLFGLPVGNNIIHSELDLSDIGMLSQKPRDLFYKGYNKTQFENPSQFKKDTNLDYLTQVMVQDNPVQVYSFWGDDDTEEYEDVDKQVKITRADIDINYKFEPTCIFIGSLVADDKSNGFNKKCTPTARSGKMDRLTTGEGTIEMIRKTPDGNIESFIIQGNNLIDGNGTWCYQIPMNLDYVKTDEYGNLVAAEDETTGIPTRTCVRFRISLADYESDSENAHLPKVLVPNNPTMEEIVKLVDVETEVGKTVQVSQGPDYNFGTYTRDESFRNLFWNNVYTVKQYIPRIQNIIFEGPHVDRNKNFSGFKTVNVNGSNNPIPYNNIRVQLTFLFIFQCIIFKALMLIIKIVNGLIVLLQKIAIDCSSYHSEFSYIVLDGSMCPTMEGVQVALGAQPSYNYKDNSWQPVASGNKQEAREILVDHTLEKIYYAAGDGVDEEEISVDDVATVVKKLISGNTDEESAALSKNTYSLDSHSSDNKYHMSDDYKYYKAAYDPTKTTDNLVSKEDITGDKDASMVTGESDYFIKCVELQFAMEYEVIHFDFYNDWINGLIYLPRWFAELKRRKRVDYVTACNENYNGVRELVQQCAVRYYQYNKNTAETSEKTCGNKCHKQSGRQYIPVLNKNGGIIQTVKNKIDDRYAYYLRPSVPVSMKNKSGSIAGIGTGIRKANLFATDIVLLGSVNDCNRYGIPTAEGYPSSSFVMPPPTGEILSDSEEMNMYFNSDLRYSAEQPQLNGSNMWKSDKAFISQNKRLPHEDTQNYETTQVELSGIDWGYNPFKVGDDDNTKFIQNQVAGHFLEIGCISSATTPKSCLNLQRICELGSEMSQSHFFRHKYEESASAYSFFPTNGVVSTMEVTGEDMRTKFALLNSMNLGVTTDTRDNFLRYSLLGYTPYAFDGTFGKLQNYLKGGTDGNKDTDHDDFIKGLNDVTSMSYLGFRFAKDVLNLKRISRESDNGGEINIDTASSCLIKIDGNNNGVFTLPVYENSFYFYFGLKNGSTAIDRLYNEYFSECNSGKVAHDEEVQ